MDAARRLAEIARLADEEIDLAEAALVIAAFEYPDLDIAVEMSRLKLLAERVRPEIASAADERGKVSALARFLFSELGLRGDAEDYENPRNSFLNDVLDRKLGIPITLSVIAIEVGRRAGVKLSGVNFPGHFLVCSTADPELILDPFGGGRFLERADCEAMLHRATGGRIAFQDVLVAPARRRQILLRMLNNLRASYRKRRDTMRAIEILGGILELEPGDGEALKERGILRVERGDSAAGIEDLERFLREHPMAPGTEAARTALTRARESTFPVN